MEEFGNGRTRIIVTELPYQVNKRMLIENMADQVKDKRLEGISDLRDESDRKTGMRIVIELKKDANPQVVLNRLFAQTQLQTTFAVSHAGAGQEERPACSPGSLSLRQMLDEYIAFQEEVITRRTRYDLRKAQERAHLLEGLLIAQDNIDEVIRIIREQLRRRQGKPDEPLRPGRRAGPGHSGHAAQAPAGTGKGEAGGRVSGAGEEDRLL